MFSLKERRAKREARRAARQTTNASAASMRKRVYETIANADGLTDEEVQSHLSMNPSTERPRRLELVRSGFIRDSGDRRQTKSGRNAIVWIAVDQ